MGNLINSLGRKGPGKVVLCWECNYERTNSIIRSEITEYVRNLNFECDINFSRIRMQTYQNRVYNICTISDIQKEEDEMEVNYYCYKKASELTKRFDIMSFADSGATLKCCHVFNTRCDNDCDTQYCGVCDISKFDNRLDYHNPQCGIESDSDIEDF